MYASVRRYEGVKNPAEVAREVREAFLPLLAQIPGFVAYYFADAGDGVMISTSIFQDKKGADESNRKAADWTAKSNLAKLLTSPPHITEGDVVVHKGK